MATYCWVCPKKSCGKTAENNSWSTPPVCKCGRAMRRDYKEEAVANTFRPSVDVYANKSKPKTASKMKPKTKAKKASTTKKKAEKSDG